MEFFNKAKAVRLKSHLNKYLVADDDQETVRQSQNGSLRSARWVVEPVEGNPHAIRLKGCHGRYLTASDEAFLLGWTGKKVLQTIPYSKKDVSIEWEPIKDGYKVKLRTKGGKFLRANGATIPWRNSITHDLPHRTATQDWVLWEVDVVDISVLDGEHLPSHASSFSTVNDDFQGSNSPSVHKSESQASSIVPPRAVGSIASENRSPSPIASQDRRLSIASDDRSSLKSGRQGGMEFFDKAKAVRLQSHLGKYLIADEDEVTVRQSRNGASQRARWTVEFVEGKRNRIRLKSCHGLYLTATDEAFLLGMTGKKVLQTQPERKTDVSIEWEPVKEGLHVKLMTNDGKFLRANGGSPPWRNSVTHDVPHRTATQSWVLWGVDIVDITISDPDMDSGSLSPASSFSSLADDYSGSPDTGSPMVQHSGKSGSMSMKAVTGRSGNISMKQIYSSLAADYSGSPDTGSPMVQHSGKSGSMSLKDISGRSGNISVKQVSGMEFFKKAKSVRLRSYHEKYLTADNDHESVIQDRAGSSKSAKWTVEFVEGTKNVIRLKSCYGLYLTATDEEFLLGVTGRKVVQSMPRKLDSSIEWEPIREGMQVRLKTRYGNYLRANGGVPPWRNSITHDIPHRHQDWILWEVDVIEIQPESPPKVSRSDSIEEDLSSSFHVRLSSHESFEGSSKKSEGRLIYYHVADEEGNVNDEIEGPSFQFKGHGVEELTEKLEEETGLQDIIVCSRNPANGKLYPLRLALPPNNATMHVVVVPSTSRVASDFIRVVPTSA